MFKEFFRRDQVMHCLQLSLAIVDEFSSELQILGLEELLMTQYSNICLPLDDDIVLVNREFERKCIVELILLNQRKLSKGYVGEGVE